MIISISDQRSKDYCNLLTLWIQTLLCSIVLGHFLDVCLQFFHIEYALHVALADVDNSVKSLVHTTNQLAPC